MSDKGLFYIAGYRLPLGKVLDEDEMFPIPLLYELFDSVTEGLEKKSNAPIKKHSIH